MRHLIAVLAAASLGAATARPAVVAAQGAPVQTVKGGILDEAKLYVATPPAVKAVVMRPFSATDADLTEGEKKEDTKKMQPIAGKTLGDEFVKQLKKLGVSDVSLLEEGATPPPEAIVVEGKFVEIDPGSATKRYLVGMGAGKSGVKVDGTIKSANGDLLATFTQRRVGVMSGGYKDSMAKLLADTTAIGEDIAKFVTAWSNGKKLK